MTLNTQNKEKNIGFKIGLVIVVFTILFVCVCVTKDIQKDSDELEYKINLAAQACSLYNYTHVVIDRIENMSSLEWYLKNTDKSEEDALKTYGMACTNVSEKDYGRESGLEPIEYKGKNQSIEQAYSIYKEMYNEYESFCDLINNPYTPASDFIDEVYEKANNITELFSEVNIKFGGNIEMDYAVEDLYYGTYYRNKRQ